MPTAEKAETIEELRKRLGGATAAVLTEYRGLTVQQVSELRKQLKAAAAEYRVVKNRLARVAIQGSPLDALRPHLTGPIAVVIARKDPAAVAKALQGFARTNPALQVRVGIVDGQLLDPQALYYWRVRASNPCGYGAFSAARSFTTANVPDLLLVDDDYDVPNVRGDYAAALSALGVSYDLWDVWAGHAGAEPDADTLAIHDQVIWFSGQEEIYPGPTDDSEVALAGYHADEVVDLSRGPLRYAGQSTCYRREAGSYGKDTRGIIRVHQFNKIEMFVYCRPEEAAAEHERLLAIEKEMLAAIEVPYRIIDTAAGDLGGPAARKYDCEAWIPTQGRYRELTSTSNCTTFQARRLNTRFRGEDGNEVAATLNGTLATTRWLVALLENHQQPDGAVYVPEALQPLIGLELLTPTR